MSLLEQMIAQHQARIRLHPRAKRIASAIVDDPALLPLVIHRQQQSLWAGHLRAMTFWTDALKFYPGFWEERHNRFTQKFTPESMRIVTCYEYSSRTPEREIPAFMRKPAETYLRLPDAAVMERILKTKREELAPQDLPWMAFHHADGAGRGYYPHEQARAFTVAQTGEWTGRLLGIAAPERVAALLGMSLADYSDALKRTQHLANELDPYNFSFACDEIARRIEAHGYPPKPVPRPNPCVVAR
jgi:hypothetical protein